MIQLVPKIVENVAGVSREDWVERIGRRLEGLSSGLTATQARAAFLGILEEWPLFGSTFFFLPHVSDSRVKGESLLAVNKAGLQFLNILTHVSKVGEGGERFYANGRCPLVAGLKATDICHSHILTHVRPRFGLPCSSLFSHRGALQKVEIHLSLDEIASTHKVLCGSLLGLAVDEHKVPLGDDGAAGRRRARVPGHQDDGRARHHPANGAGPAPFPLDWRGMQGRGLAGRGDIATGGPVHPGGRALSQLQGLCPAQARPLRRLLTLPIHQHLPCFRCPGFR